MYTEYEAVAIAESKYGRSFRKVSSGEYVSIGGCPWCGDGGKGSNSDRFRLIINGKSDTPRVWCRKCDQYEFINSDSDRKRLDDIELRLAAVEAQQKEHNKRLAALEVMQHSTDHIAYYNNMINNNPNAIEYWASEGMDLDTISQYKLGYCDVCPTAKYSSSYTIPVLHHSVPYNIRHRLTNPNGQGKYRPHMAGLPVMLFNSDNLESDSDFIVVVEGEKKSIIVTQETGYPSVGVMGAQSFKESWVSKFDKFKRIYIVFDPDVYEKAVNTASLFKKRGIVVSLPLKADDFFVKAGAKIVDFDNYLAWGRPV